MQAEQQRLQAEQREQLQREAERVAEEHRRREAAAREAQARRIREHEEDQLRMAIDRSRRDEAERCVFFWCFFAQNATLS